MTGVEPDKEGNVTDDLAYSYVHQQSQSAADALQSSDIKGHNLTTIDPELQELNAAWKMMPKATRNAIMAIVRST